MKWHGLDLESAESMVTAFTLLERADDKVQFMCALAHEYYSVCRGDWGKSVDMAAGRLLIGISVYELKMGFTFDLARKAIIEVKFLVKLMEHDG